MHAAIAVGAPPMQRLDDNSADLCAYKYTIKIICETEFLSASASDVCCIFIRW